MSSMHTLKNSARKSAKRVGRGGKRGKTSGRGMKGQNARAGGAGRPEIRDLIKKLPKLRGHGKNRARTVVHKPNRTVVNVAQLDAWFESGATITPASFVDIGLWSAQKIKKTGVKILGNGELSKKLTIEGCQISTTAKEKVEKAGGTVK